MHGDDIQQRFLADLGRPWMAVEIFDAVPDIAFFVKDREGRYVVVNQALADRCVGGNRDKLLGRTAAEVFPEELGESFTEQDFEVLREGRAIRGQLELHLYPDGREGWCLTWKEPVANANGEVVGVAGISRDLSFRPDASGDFGAVAEVLGHIDAKLDQTLSMAALAARAGWSTFQLDQRIRALFGVTASQYVTRRRIERSRHLLERTDQSISEIALACGYGDQSAFTRQFRRSVGLPPRAYRERRRSGR